MEHIRTFTIHVGEDRIPGALFPDSTPLIYRSPISGPENLGGLEDAMQILSSATPGEPEATIHWDDEEAN